MAHLARDADFACGGQMMAEGVVRVAVLAGAGILKQAIKMEGVGVLEDVREGVRGVRACCTAHRVNWDGAFVAVRGR